MLEPTAIEPAPSLRVQLASRLGLAVAALSDQDTAELLTNGNLAVLSPAVRTAYYIWRCKQLNLDPLSKPFDVITIEDRRGGKRTILYANRGAADQLRNSHLISVTDIQREETPEYFTIWLKGRDMNTGREEWNCASVFIAPLKGDALATAKMKCMTKALRRLTLAMVGSGLLDETEAETIRGARPAEILSDNET